MKRTILTTSLVLLLAGPLLAQAHGGEKFDVEAAMKRVRELIEQTEEMLAETLRPGGSTGEATAAGQETKKAMDELLKQSRTTGDEIVAAINDILEKAPRGGGGGGGDQEEQKPKPGEDEARKEQEKKLGENDPKNSAKGEPKSGEENKEEPNDKAEAPKAEEGDASRPNPEESWIANLPPELRLRYQNEEWEKIPPKWRDKIEKYLKRLADEESRRRE